ncbi:MAG: sigma-54 dependent transcriptional regulator [Pseudomonadota bacterium]
MANQKPCVLIVEDTGSIAAVFSTWLGKHGFDSEIAETGIAGLEKLRSGKFALALLDLDLPEMSGMDVLKSIRQEGVSIPIVVVTASGSIGTVIDAMRNGAYDYLVKPTAEERLVTTVKNALERSSLQQTITTIKKKSSRAPKHGFVGSSMPMIAVYRAIDSIAQSKAGVFITGESGTGKEVCAEAVHRASPRSDGPFVPINCAAIPKELMESEIFGHLPGAFTGATSERAGAALSANGGTLFLDEICEMELGLQAKLLRFLQTEQVRKLGSDKVVNVDVRIVAATNRDPMLEVQEGRFREDLFYRLHVLPVHLPPLREREADPVEIATHFLKQMSEEEGKSFTGFSEDAEDALLRHSWPGNIRELQNTIRKSVILNDAELITSEMLALDPAFYSNLHAAPPLVPDLKNGSTVLGINLEQEFWEIERDVIEAAIKHCGNSIPKASEMLGLSPSTIYRKREAWMKEGDLQEA